MQKVKQTGRLREAVYGLRHGIRSRTVGAILLCTLTAALFSSLITAKNIFVILEDGQMRVVESYATDARRALSDAGVTISAGDLVSMPEGKVSGITEVVINRSFPVTIAVDGMTRMLTVRGGTVADVLSDSGIEVGAYDEVTPQLGTPVDANMNISIVRVSYVTQSSTQEIPYTTVRNASVYIPYGSEMMKQEGSAGQRTCTCRITYRDGVEVERTVLSETVIAEPVNEVIEYGSGGILTLGDGTQLHYSYILDVKATAYTTEGYSDKTNALGKVARPGTIAVDPRVIPLHTQVYVTSPSGSWVYGQAVAEDTGGAIKGNIIDLYFDTRSECFSFGRRSARVYILD